MKLPSLSNVLTTGLMGAMVMTTAATAQSTKPPALEANSVRFAAERGFQPFGEESDALKEMRARLQDPQKRAALRAERRADILQTHYGVAEALELDEVTFQSLIDLLTDQQMQQLEEFHLRVGQPPDPGHDPMKRLQADAERLSRNVAAQRDLLGPEKADRYDGLRSTLGERMQLRELDDRLDASNKLDTTQRERLIELLHAQNSRALEQRRAQVFGSTPLLGSLSLLRSSGTSSHEMPSREELERRSLLHMITSNEQVWRQMPQLNRQLREQAASILTAPQLAALEQIHAEREQSMQARIEDMREQAGLIRTIPEQAQVVDTAPAIVTGTVKLSLKLSVNRGEPRYYSEVVSGGKSVTFEIAEGLFVEATPTLYENDMYNLDVAYYEAAESGKRRVGNMGQMGTLTKTPRGEAFTREQLNGGSSANVLVGSKAYMVEMSSVVESI